MFNTNIYIKPLLKSNNVNSPTRLGINKDVVSFSSIDVNKEDAFNLRNIPDLPCACCGKKMINEEIAKTYTSKIFQGSAQSALKKLKPISKDFRSIEKTIYNLLKRSANNYPNDDLNSLLNRRYYYHLGRLEEKQLKIINSAVNIGEKLSENSKTELNKALIKSRNILFQEAKNERQKRSRIIKEFENLFTKIPEKDIVKKMINVLKTLPNSSNDVDSYVVKYSQRGNREIGQRMIKPSLPTLDHIKPASKNGEDDFSNLIVMCSKCNSERSTTPYSEWLDQRPSMYKNIQKQMDKIIKEINLGKLKNFDSYPKDIQKTLYKESGQKIKLDISDLKPKHLSSN